MNWTTAFVEDSIGPSALRMVKETAPKNMPGKPPLNGTKLLVDMYEAFKDEGMFRPSLIIALMTHFRDASQSSKSSLHRPKQDKGCGVSSPHMT